MTEQYTNRALRVMKEHKIGVRPLRDGWWPDVCLADLNTEQLRILHEELYDKEPFEEPLDAVRAVSSALGLANFP